MVSALRIYQSWLRFNGELEGAEGFDPEPPKYSRRLPDYHNTDEMQALVCAWEGERGPLALRNSAMLHLLYATGIRASELCGLNLGDVEPRARLLRVRGKGNRERVVPYGARAAEALERWLELRHLLSHNGPDRQEAEGRRQGDQGPEGSSDFSLTTGGRGPASSGFQSPVSNERGAMSNEPGATARPGHSALNPDPSTGPGSPVPGPSDRPADALFLNHRGGRLTRRGLHDVVDRSALRAGIVKSVSTHKLRHACATHLLEGGADVRLVQELLGHQSLATTQVYTAVTRTQLLDAFDRAHPRAKK